MPAFSATRALRRPTERQLFFIRALVAERTAASLVPVGAEVGDALTGRPVRSDLIDRIMQIPRAAVTTPGASPSEGEIIATPSSGCRAGRMLLAGGIEATVTLADGRHVTVVIRTRVRTGRGWRNGSPGEEGARTSIKILGSRIGWVNVDQRDRWHLTLRTRRDEYHTAIQALFLHAAGLGPGERVQEASRCGRCFRTLTDPVSIDRGIGPECFGRDTGSQHVAAERDVEAWASSSRTEFVPLPHPFPEERERFDRVVGSNSGYQADEAQRVSTLADRGVNEAPVFPPDVQRARALIVEALDAYLGGVGDGDGDGDVAFALRTFDQLARDRT